MQYDPFSAVQRFWSTNLLWPLTFQGRTVLCLQDRFGSAETNLLSCQISLKNRFDARWSFLGSFLPFLFVVWKSFTAFVSPLWRNDGAFRSNFWDTSRRLVLDAKKAPLTDFFRSKLLVDTRLSFKICLKLSIWDAQQTHWLPYQKFDFANLLISSKAPRLCRLVGKILKRFLASSFSILRGTLTFL